MALFTTAKPHSLLGLAPVVDISRGAASIQGPNIIFEKLGFHEGEGIKGNFPGGLQGFRLADDGLYAHSEALPVATAEATGVIPMPDGTEHADGRVVTVGSGYLDRVPGLTTVTNAQIGIAPKDPDQALVDYNRLSGPNGQLSDAAIQNLVQGKLDPVTSTVNFGRWDVAMGTPVVGSEQLFVNAGDVSSNDRLKMFAPEFKLDQYVPSATGVDLSSVGLVGPYAEVGRTGITGSGPTASDQKIHFPGMPGQGPADKVDYQDTTLGKWRADRNSARVAAISQQGAAYDGSTTKFGQREYGVLEVQNGELPRFTPSTQQGDAEVVRGAGSTGAASSIRANAPTIIGRGAAGIPAAMGATGEGIVATTLKSLSDLRAKRAH